jgi:hypothetical protein
MGMMTSKYTKGRVGQRNIKIKHEAPKNEWGSEEQDKGFRKGMRDKLMQRLKDGKKEKRS